jgi:hypothetical protein
MRFTKGPKWVVRFKQRRKRGTVLSTNEVGFIISSSSQGSGASPALSGIALNPALSLFYLTESRLGAAGGVVSEGPLHVVDGIGVGPGIAE